VQTGVPTDRRYVYTGRLVCIPVCMPVLQTQLPSLQNTVYVFGHAHSRYSASLWCTARLCARIRIRLLVLTESTNVNTHTHTHTHGYRTTAYRPRLCIASRMVWKYHDIFENIKISKISKISWYFFIFSIFSRDVVIVRVLYNNGYNTLMQYLMTISYQSFVLHVKTQFQVQFSLINSLIVI